MPLPTFLAVVPQSCLVARHFSSSLYATGAFQAATLELRGSESEQKSSYVGSFRGTAWDSRVSSTNSIPAGVCSQKLWGLIFLALESWVGGPGVGLGLLAPKIYHLNYYLPHVDVGPACLHLHPSHQCGWMWFL